MNKLTYIYGVHPIKEAIKAGKQIDKVFIQTDISNPTKKEIFNLCKEHSIPFQFVPKEKINSLVNGNHQGVVASISPIIYEDLEHIIPWLFENGVLPLILVLDKITDVHNFGAIIRTAECAGVNAVVVPNSNSAQINSQTIKISSGALYNVPICRSNSLVKTIDYLKNSGFQIVCCTEKASANYTSFDYTIPTVVVVGSEEKGISNEILKKSDLQVRIPLAGKIDSLNVSVATGIMLYEVVRQRMNSNIKPPLSQK